MLGKFKNKILTSAHGYLDDLWLYFQEICHYFSSNLFVRKNKQN